MTYQHDASAYGRKNEYDAYLDEVCGPVVIGSLTYAASVVLFEVDPIAYAVGYDEWLWDAFGDDEEVVA